VIPPPATGSESSGGWPIGQAPRVDLRLRPAATRVLIVIAALAALVPLAAQRATPRRRASSARAPVAQAGTERRVPFRVGEQLSYDITWSSFITATAATATVSVREKRAAYGSLAYYLVAEGRPTPLVAMLYSVYYKADSWLDVHTLLPLRASVFSQEAGRRENKVTLFERVRGIARYEEQEGTRTDSSSLKVPADTYDPLSAIFVLRTVPLAAGMRLSMPMVLDGELYQVQLTVERREPLRTTHGTRTAWRIKPVVLDRGKPAASPRGMLLWLSDDARRLPLKMQVEIPVGRFELTMTAAK